MTRVILAFLLLLAASPVSGQELPAGFQESIAIAGLDLPTAVRFSPDGRVFVAEKSGLVKVFDDLDDLTPTVFADLRTNVMDFWDRGLLGLALHPSFPAVPYVYVLYTLDAEIGGTPPRWNDNCPDPPGATTDGCVVGARLSRLEAAGNVMTGPEAVLVEGWCQQFPSHSIGSLDFGSDGALYVSAGDGASFGFVDWGQTGQPQVNPCADPPGGVGATLSPPTAEGGALRSQDLRTLADPVALNGTILRLDPMTGAGLPDNPLYGGGTADDDRIVAYGLRNPFRMTVRPSSTEVWIGDVGWNEWEEIDVLADPLGGVGNFGWPCYEGVPTQAGYDGADLDVCQNLYASPGAATAPFFSYYHADQVAAGDNCATGSSAVSGLAFYQGGSYPTLYDGALFFADYSRNCIWTMLPGPGGEPDPSTRALFGRGVSVPVDLKIGPGGDLFYVDIYGGTVRRIQYTAGNRPPEAVATASPTNGQPPLLVQFDGTGSSDPDVESLTYAWDLDGDGQYDDSTDPSPSFLYGSAGVVQARLRVTDPHAASGTTAITITVGNTAPTAAVTAPTSALTWNVGDEIAFTGTGTDPEEGALPPSAFAWRVILHHCPSNCHQHTVQNFTGIDSGSFIAPDHEYPSHLELRLTVTDAGGLQSTTSVLLYPNPVTLSFASNPVGLTLVVGGGSGIAPFDRTVIAGSQSSVSASSPQLLAGTSWAFADWSDAGAQSHIVVAPDGPATYTATFTPTCGATPASCGDGRVDVPCEQCDLGAANCPVGAPCVAGCTAECRVVGRCTGSGAFCAAAADCPSGEGCCGDTVVDGPAEACDDGNRLAGDCCSPTCAVESPATCEPQACSALGPHLVAATVTSADLTDKGADGTRERWRTKGAFTLGTGQSVDPDVEGMALLFSENGVVRYAPTLGAGRFEQNKETCSRRWKFASRRADTAGAIGWKSGTLRQNRLKGGASGACASSLQYAFGSGSNATMQTSAGAHLRQSVRIGDDCFTTLLACTPASGGRLKCKGATP